MDSYQESFEVVILRSIFQTFWFNVALSSTAKHIPKKFYCGKKQVFYLRNYANSKHFLEISVFITRQISLTLWYILTFPLALKFHRSFEILQGTTVKRQWRLRTIWGLLNIVFPVVRCGLLSFSFSIYVGLQILVSVTLYILPHLQLSPFSFYISFSG